MIDDCWWVIQMYSLGDPCINSRGIWTGTSITPRYNTSLIMNRNAFRCIINVVTYHHVQHHKWCCWDWSEVGKHQRRPGWTLPSFHPRQREAHRCLLGTHPCPRQQRTTCYPWTQLLRSEKEFWQRLCINESWGDENTPWSIKNNNQIGMFDDLW